MLLEHPGVPVPLCCPCNLQLCVCLGGEHQRELFQSLLIPEPPSISPAVPTPWFPVWLLHSDCHPLVLESLSVRPELLEGISVHSGANEQAQEPWPTTRAVKVLSTLVELLKTSGGSPGSNFYSLFSFAAESTSSGLLKSGIGLDRQAPTFRPQISTLMFD